MLHSVTIRLGSSKGPASKGRSFVKSWVSNSKEACFKDSSPRPAPPKRIQKHHWCELHAWRSFSLSRQLHGAPGGHDNGSVLSDICLFTESAEHERELAYKCRRLCLPSTRANLQWAAHWDACRRRRFPPRRRLAHLLAASRRQKVHRVSLKNEKERKKCGTISARGTTQRYL
jgi:hypothetical protein